MADEQTQGLIGLPGWMYGQPDFEANPEMQPIAKLGANGVPGWYDEAIQQWPRLASLIGQGRAEASSGTLEHRNPPDDETPEEVAFNDALLDLISHRTGLESGDGPVWGTPALLGWLYDVPWRGLGVAAPYWHEAGADPMTDGRILLRPLLTAAIQRWTVDYMTQRPTGLWYMAVPRYTQIPYEHLLHITHGGGPGEYYGRGELRPLIAPFSAWREAIRSGADAMRAAKGRLIVEEPERLDAPGKARIQSLITGFDGGRVDSFSHPKGSAATVGYPSGGTPDFAAWMNALDRQAELLFADRTSSLGVSSSGSRATAEVLSGEDATAQASQWERIIDRGVQRLGAWIAKQVGYTGRIRPVYLAVRDVAQPPADRLALYTGIEALRAQGAPLDVIRSAATDVGLDPDVIAPITAGAGVESKILPVGSLQSAMAIAQALSGAPGTVPISAGAAIELLKAAGVPADAAERIVASSSQQAAAAPPAATLSAKPPVAPGSIIADLHDCGCRSAHCAHLAEPVSWPGRDGADYPHNRAPMVLTIDGANVSPELTVAYAELDAVREIADVGLSVALAPIAEAHRAALWAALETGYSERESVAIYDRYRDEYESAILAYQQQLAAQSRTQAQAEAQASPVPTKRDGLPPEALQQWAAREADRVRLGARAAADTIASRVQGEVVGAYTAGATAATFTTQQTAAGLAREAYPSGARIEAVATVQEAAAEREDGLVVIAALRSSQRDPEVCEWCRSQDGLSWQFPGDDARFLSYMDRHSLPDQSCAGRSRCRCRITLVWGRQPS